MDNVSFEVERGQILGFLGPNGAGKSTTMKMITGFIPPTSGTARVGGHDIREHPIEAKRLMGYLPESGPLYPEMTVGELLRFVGRVRGMEKAVLGASLERVRGICHLEGVWNQTIETLSKGYRQRVGMAQAILHDPPCLIMDEPTDGLDPNQKQTVRRLIASMARDKAIILSTHILEEVDAMCNRVIIIARGRVLVDETPEGLKRRHPRYNAVSVVFRRDRDRDEARLALEDHPSVARVEVDGEQLRLLPREKRDLRDTLWAMAHERRWEIAGFDPEPIRLEEVFRSLTETGAAA